MICPDCGKSKKNLKLHAPYCSPNNATPEDVPLSASVAVAEPEPSSVPAQPRSRRGQRAHREAVLRPIDQIPVPPGGGSIQATGAWAYYLRKDGATIADALVLYPNGGVPETDDPRLAARYGENHLYYRERQARRGLEFIGSTLNETGVRRLVEILAENRADEILFCEDEVAACQTTAATSDRPEIRDQARRRQGQFEKRLEYLNQPLDQEGLLTELKEIARAQQLARVDPNVLRVMRSMIGEVNEKMAEAIGRFQSGRVLEGAPAAFSGRGADASIFDASGRSHIEV